MTRNQEWCFFLLLYICNRKEITTYLKHNKMEKKTIQKTPKQVLLSVGLISLIGLGMPQSSMAVPVVNSVVQDGSITGVISDITVSLLSVPVLW